MNNPKALKTKAALAVLLVLLATAMIWPAWTAKANTVPSPSLQSSPVSVYGDSLATPWQDWSWDATHNLSSPSPVQSGSAAISVSFAKAWAAIYLHRDSGLSTAGYTHLEFYIHGGSAGNQKINVVANKNGANAYPVTATASAWTKISVPLSSLGSPAAVSDLFFQDASGTMLPKFYLDSIQLVDNNTAAPTATLAARTATALPVTATQVATAAQVATATQIATATKAASATTMVITSTPAMAPATATATRTFLPIITSTATQPNLPLPTAVPTATAKPSATPVVTVGGAIYSDLLVGDWQNWSWNTTINLANTSPFQSGSKSIAVKFNAAWAGLNLHSNGASTSGYDQLVFWIHGGSTGGQKMNLVANKNTAAVYPVTAAANSWKQVIVPLANLGWPTSLTELTWQDSTGVVQAGFYIDSISLAASGQPTPVPTATPLPGNYTLQVDAAANQRPISPDIYGMNFADETLAKELRLPVNRYGGNATTRYNWQNDTSNRASDWFFENIPNGNSNPGALPNGSSSDKFADQNRRTGTNSLVTIPMIGWAPKSRDITCGFSVSKYGAQQRTDGYRPDCGNGLKPDGTKINGNNPTDTSVAIGPSFIQDWVRHLTGLYGTAANGGVKYYNLDNEPMLWNSTHRDVHPLPVSYDEMRDLTYQYAPAIKAVDPSAKTLGPVLWGWTAYFYSAKDSSAGGSWWSNPQDRLAHGNLPFIEWYLQQMKAYDQSHNQRILDYLDLHYYPQSGVALTAAGDATLQAKRLRATRSLWDPNYTDESWINEPVRLIPRMRDWVNNNYPGTKLAMTEYNFGGLESINGAITQADVLGIFGREGLDLATIWDPPATNQPGAYAFRIYRNYDGAGGSFGETSVKTTSVDSDKISIFAAKRASDGALTLMIINKTSSSQIAAVSLANFSAGPTAKVYRYSAANLGSIVRQADQAISGGSFSSTLPGNSITLVVIPHP